MATFLADKSALTRRDTRPEAREALEPLLVAGEVATCGIAELTGQEARWVVPRGSVA